MRLPKPSSRSVPTIACSGTPAWRVRVPISPTSLPCSVCSSSLPSPVTTARDARMRSSKSSASSTNGAPGSSVAPYCAHRPPLRPPAPPVIGTPRGSLRERLRELVQPGFEPLRPCAASAPFCGPKTFGASSNGVRTSHSTTIFAPADAAGRPRSPRSRPRRRRSWPSRRRRRGSPPRRPARRRRSARRCRRWRRSRRPSRASARGRWPSPSRRSPCRRPRRGRSRCGRRRRAGPCTVTATQLAAELGQQRVERPLAAVGHRAEVGRHQPGALEPAPDRTRDLGGAERALEGVGGDEDGALRDGHGAASCQASRDTRTDTPRRTGHIRAWRSPGSRPPWACCRRSGASPSSPSSRAAPAASTSSCARSTASRAGMLAATLRRLEQRRPDRPARLRRRPRARRVRPHPPGAELFAALTPLSGWALQHRPAAA